MPFDILHVLIQWKYLLVSTEMVLRSRNPIKPTTQLFAFIFQLHDTENLGMLPSSRFACRYTNKNMWHLGRVVILSTLYSRGRRSKSTCRRTEGKEFCCLDLIFGNKISLNPPCFSDVLGELFIFHSEFVM